MRNYDYYDDNDNADNDDDGHGTDDDNNGSDVKYVVNGTLGRHQVVPTSAHKTEFTDTTNTTALSYLFSQKKILKTSTKSVFFYLADLDWILCRTDCNSGL